MEKISVGYIAPIICMKCGELFDLNEDFRESGGDIYLVLKEKCGASELLCWDCRDCEEDL